MLRVLIPGFGNRVLSLLWDLDFEPGRDYAGLTARRSFFPQPVPTAMTETPMTYNTKEYFELLIQSEE